MMAPVRDAEWPAWGGPVSAAHGVANAAWPVAATKALKAGVVNGSQAGQAMAEAVVGILVLGVLLHLVAATDRVQDLALRASMAGRYAAMLLTRDDAKAGNELAQHVREQFFTGPRHRWQTRQGDAMLQDPPGSVRVGVGERPGRAGMQVGQRNLQATNVRQEVLRPDRGIAVATVDVMPRLGTSRELTVGIEREVGLRLDPWESMSLRVRRHTAILTDTGQATSDRGVTQRLQTAPQTWAASAGDSTRVGREVTRQLSGIDRPWGRPLPHFDWLTPWETLVPADRIGRREGSSWDR